MKYTIYHGEVYYWIIGTENQADELLTILRKLQPMHSAYSNWMIGHWASMSNYTIIKLYNE